MRIHGRWVWWANHCLESNAIMDVSSTSQQRQVTPCDKMATLCVKMADFGHDMWISLQIIHWCGLCFMWFMLGPHRAPGDSETLAHGPQQKDLTASPWRSECFLRWCLQLSSNDVFHSIWMFTQLHSIPPHFVPFHSVRFSLNFIPLHSISLRLILFLSQFNAFYSDRIPCPFCSIRSNPLATRNCCIMSTGETCSWRQWLGAFLLGQECWTRSGTQTCLTSKKSLLDDTNHRLNHAHLPVCTWTQNSSHTRGPFEVAMMVWPGTCGNVWNPHPGFTAARWSNMCEQDSSQWMIQNKIHMCL